MTYEDFKRAIQKTLREASGPLTWTEIRTRAKLPQKFPNISGCTKWKKISGWKEIATSKESFNGN